MSKVEEVKAHVEKGKTKLIPGLVQAALDEGDCSHGYSPGHGRRDEASWARNSLPVKFSYPRC